MAKAPPVAARWIPEDDLLLKNAVEGGASLEALAKGAVQFSRRFTLRELRDRWHSLLYDPDISGQSSAHMFELEISGFNPSSKFVRSDNNLKGNKEISQKRKLGSIRRKYYAMRKKFRSEFFSNSAFSLFEPDALEFSGHGADFQKRVTLDGDSMGQNCILGDSISDDLRLQEEDLDILRHAFPETVRDITAASDTTNVSRILCPRSVEENCPKGMLGRYGFDKNVSPSLRGTGNNMLNANIENRNGSFTLKHCSRNENTGNVSVELEGLPFKTTKSDDYSFQEIAFASEQPHLRHLRVQDISAPPLHDMCLQDVDQVSDDMLHDNANGQGNRSAVHTVEFADPDSLLNLSNESEILLMDVEEMHAEDQHCSSNITPVIQDSHIDYQENHLPLVNIEALTVSETNFTLSPTVNPVVLEATATSSPGEEQINPQSVVNVSSKSSDITELSDGQIFCTLNSEDTEIPCNDDIFLLIHPSASFGSSVTQPDLRSSVGASAAAHGKNYEQVFNLPTKSNDCMNAFGGPQKVGIHRSPESLPIDQLVGFSAKIQMNDSRTNTLLPGFAYKVNGDPGKGGLVHTISNTPSNRLTEKEVAGVAIRVRDSPSTVTFPESVDNSSGSDQEESLIDAEVPYFSDIEAMILEMDLDPYEQDYIITRQATSYMCDDTKRTIVRLEQGARSCLQRVMISQGALAVLYGRHLRHYITKPEIVLGRSTEDAYVDIDLRKEGRANKISRRQAIIKMEADGSFFLKNLGKSSMSVNGMTIETGQLLSLSCSCLIEIKGMSFMFEINERYVKQYLVNFGQKNKKSIKSEQLGRR
ncbi:uncharacterized protein LOC142528430 [Primulina tabacum]|uniref:uncharacterized protein LOC142528430 n=1 Tax=Primulina tabacum TaxID=48773 RepID=UPI003F59FABE